ncbi:MAG: ECF transporter S component [Firmicutes bacterium]|nr:ECF transporter S component [Bacillota bacterium]
MLSNTQAVKISRTHYIVKVALLAAMAALVKIFEFRVPMMPVFLELDLSEVPVLLGTFALGPMAGIVVELIKNMVHALSSTETSGIGEIANFIVGIAFVIPAGLIYRRRKHKKGAIMALVAGSVSMVLIAAVMNYFVFIPLYQRVLGWPLDAIISLGTQANPAIVDLKSLVVMAIIPFNILKAVVVSVVTLLVYKKVSPMLHR